MWSFVQLVLFVAIALAVYLGVTGRWRVLVEHFRNKAGW